MEQRIDQAQGSRLTRSALTEKHDCLTWMYTEIQGPDEAPPVYLVASIIKLNC